MTGTLEITAPSEIAVGTHFHAQHGITTIPVILPAYGEDSWLLLPSSVYLLSGGTIHQKTSIPASSR